MASLSPLSFVSFECKEKPALFLNPPAVVRRWPWRWRACISPQDSTNAEKSTLSPSSPSSSSSSSSSSPSSSSSSSSSASPSPSLPKKPRTTAESTDWIASSLTRRFGLGAGLAWVGFLAFGVISEQIKTRREVFLEEQGTRDVVQEVVTLPNKLEYVDLRVGGGSSPRAGDLVVVDIVGRVLLVRSNNGDGGEYGPPFIDTFAQKRPIALVFGQRPLAPSICPGVEEALQSMRVGGKRKVTVPPELGFGTSGNILGDGVSIPPDATLEYTLQLLRVSIAPS